MDILSPAELQKLIQHKGLGVSIYMPKHPMGADIQQDRIRLKNLLREAEKGLQKEGMRPPLARELLKPIQELLDDNLFWKREGQGLAIFIAAGILRHYRLPLPFDELVEVSQRFHVNPLLPLFINSRFFVLALSQNKVRLLVCSRYSCSEVNLDGIVPSSLAEALRYEGLEKPTVRRPVGSLGSRGTPVAISHGASVGADDPKDRIRRYFNMVDRGLHELLREENAPLALVAVDYLMPLYREANTYQYLMPQGIAGNPDEITLEELHQRAWQIVAPYFEKEQQVALNRYNHRAGTGLTSSDIKEIVLTAYSRRVEALFVGPGFRQWGRFDSDKMSVELHDSPGPGDEDLIDLAVIYTILHRGAVYSLPPDKMPGGVPLAATFRY